MVNVVDAVMKGEKKIVPEILVFGGTMTTVDGLAASLMNYLSAAINDKKA